MSGRLLSTLSLPLSTLSALAGAGYETVTDLSNSTPEQLSRDLNISLPASQAVFSATRPSATLPMTQSAAAMMATTRRYSTACPPLDKLLGGGLKRGSVLELNGPPGCGKEQIAAHAVKGFVEAEHEVLFVDMQNMILPATIKRILAGPTAQADALDLVHYLTLHTAAEFVVFMRNLPAYLTAHPGTALLVLNSLVFPLQQLEGRDRYALLELLKSTLALVCASMNLTVIITSHLASKLVDGPAAGTNDRTAPSKWIMIPFIKQHSDFPSGRTYRVLIVPQWKTSGVMRLLHSPTHVPTEPAREEAYQKIGGTITVAQ
ncbi:P-loop containing nucleoside triphosphate hydrolase protein [Fomes fomentarius]|nr:P-loop containing nucleoside triphosphate hydrolase protein [Fomes fomentarius]